MSGRNAQRKPGTTRGSPRRSRTAKASRISRYAVKSRCACEWGGWGRVSDDGPGHYNLDRSEGPWGRANAALMAVLRVLAYPDSERDVTAKGEQHEGRMQTKRCEGYAGSRLNRSIVWEGAV